VAGTDDVVPQRETARSRKWAASPCSAAQIAGCPSRSQARLQARIRTHTRIFSLLDMALCMRIWKTHRTRTRPARAGVGPNSPAGSPWRQKRSNRERVARRWGQPSFELCGALQLSTMGATFRSPPGRAAPGPSGLPTGNGGVQKFDFQLRERRHGAFGDDLVHAGKAEGEGLDVVPVAAK
jgi:hypothetical protein